MNEELRDRLRDLIEDYLNEVRDDEKASESEITLYELRSDLQSLGYALDRAKLNIKELKAQMDMIFPQTSANSAELRFHETRISKVEDEYEERMRRIEDKIYE